MRVALQLIRCILSKNVRSVKKEYFIYLFIFLACVLSRVFTAVDFPEDLENLNYHRHVLNSYSQWHELSFSPLYINEVKLLMSITKSNLAFAFAGGLATFILIIASLRLLNQPVYSFYGALLVMLVFFNPMIWLFGNRYTADLTGAALVMSIIALGLRSKSKWDVYLFWIALSLLPWIKVMYLIMVAPVVIYVILEQREKIKQSWVALFPVGISLALIAIVSKDAYSIVSPLVPEYLVREFWWGENSMFKMEVVNLDAMSKVLLFFKTFWANAAGGWWTDRPFWLVYPTAIIIIPVITFLFNKTFFNSSLKEYVVLTSAVLYAGIIFLVSDFYTMQSYVLPLVSLFLVIVVLGIQGILNEIETKLTYVAIGLGLIFYALNTYNLTMESKNGTAVRQAIREIEEKQLFPITVSSLPLHSQVLYSSDIAPSEIAMYLYYEDTTLHIPMMVMSMIRRGNDLESGYFIGDKKLPEEINHSVVTPVKVFSHDPYMNPVWPSLTLYKFERRKP